MLRATSWIVALVASTAVAAAQPGRAPGPPAPKPVERPVPNVPPLVGGTEVLRLTTPTGFIDDAVAAQGDRLAYVVADAATKAELHVVSLASKAELAVVDLAPVTLQPIELHFVGARLLVLGRTDDGRVHGALVELADKGKGKPAGTVVYKIAPATHLTVITRDGKPRVAVHRATKTAAGGTRHEVELLALDTGRRVGAVRALELDGADTHKPQEFRVNHWSDGWTRAHGIKAGEWDRKEDQRSPDAEATYDFVTGKLTKIKITDLFEQRRRFQALADADGRLDFVRVAQDWSGVQVWSAGKPVSLKLDQPFATYDNKSLQGMVEPDGSAWLVLQVDPVNADAVARKKADPEYVDVFRASRDGQAVRKMRVLAHMARVRFGVIGDKVWLLERNKGFERGGKSLAIYQLAP